MNRLTREERAKIRQQELDVAFGDNETTTSEAAVESKSDVSEGDSEIDQEKSEPYAVQAALSIRQQNQAIVNKGDFWNTINPEQLGSQLSTTKAHEDQFDAPPANASGESSWRKDK